MARIVNNYGAFDHFKTKCPHCGVEIEYTRRDIRAHVRWDNGFIYCPICKEPFGHDEKFLITSGEEIIKNTPKHVIDEYRSQVKVFKILRAIFLPVGLVTMIIMPFVFIILGTAKEIQIANSSLYAAICFFIGLSLVIASGVFRTMIRNRLPFIQG